MSAATLRETIISEMRAVQPSAPGRTYAPPAGQGWVVPTGATYAHNKALAEAIANAVVGSSGTLLPLVYQRWDASSALPVGAEEGTRYLCTVSGNGWTANSIYEYNGSTWDETAPETGNLVWVEDESLLYAYTGTVWDGIGDGGTVAHALVGGYHTASGLTTGHFLKATGATTFAFGAHGLTYTDVGAAASGHDHSGVYDPAGTGHAEASAHVSAHESSYNHALLHAQAHALGSHSDTTISLPATNHVLQYTSCGDGFWFNAQLYHSQLANVGANDHHNQAHALVGTDHTAAGLTTGHFLKATGATTFAFGAHGLTYTDVGAAASGHDHSGVYDPAGTGHAEASAHVSAHEGSYNHALLHAQAHALGSHSDVIILNPAANHVIQYSVGGAYWYNALLEHAGLLNVGANDHHNQAHTLTGNDHTASGLTSGHFLKATGATTFGFAAHGLTYSDVGAQQSNTYLTAIAGLAVTDSNVIVGNGTTWVAESGATARASLGLGTSDTPQFARLGLGAAADASVIAYVTSADATTTPTATLNNSSTGDACLRFALASTRSYALGIDNSDSDKVVLSTAASATATLGTSNLMTIDTSGNAVHTGTVAATTLGAIDTNASHYLRITAGSDLSADRVLTFTTGDAARTLTLNGNATVDDWFDQAVKAASTPQFARLGLAAAADATAILYATTAHATSPAAWYNQSSTGDVYTRYSLASTRSYAWGIDNSDSDKMILSTAASGTAVPGTGNLITILSTGDMIVAGYLDLGTTAAMYFGGSNAGDSWAMRKESATLCSIAFYNAGSAYQNVLEMNDSGNSTFNGTLSLTGSLYADHWAEKTGSHGCAIDHAVTCASTLRATGVSVGRALTAGVLGDFYSAADQAYILVATAAATKYGWIRTQADGAYSEFGTAGTNVGATKFGATINDYAFMYGTNVSGMVIGTISAAPVIIGTNDTANLTIASGGAITCSSTLQALRAGVGVAPHATTALSVEKDTGGTYDSTTVAAIFGDVDSSDCVYIIGNTINTGFGYDTDDYDMHINYRGHNGGTTRYRSLTIDDGKGAAVVSIVGSTKASVFAGTLKATTLRASADGGGEASTVSIASATSTSLSSGVGTVKMGGATNRDNTGWLKIYVGTTANWIPYWTTVTG